MLENGFRLAETNGANLKVVTAFALLHDSRRENDGYDPEHGFREPSMAGTFGSRCRLSQI